MKDIHEEQAEKSASEFGKFGSAEELLSAYNALESEFTKRCQLLKQLQAELSDLRAQAENAPAPDDTATEQVSSVAAEVEHDSQDAHPTSQPVTAEDGGNECDAQSLAVLIARAAECAETLCAVPEVMDACIAEYKKRLSCGHARYSVPAGMAVIAAPARPKTLSDAKALADKLLSQQ